MFKNSSDTKKKTKQESTAIRGLFVFSAAIAVVVSLLSFAYGSPGRNWLGVVGFTLGKLGHAAFGVGSYFFCAYFIWIGWRLLFHKPINHPYVKAFFVCVYVASLGVLFALIEDTVPSTAKWFGNLFYPSLWHRKLHYHLGGAFFYYIYHDLPHVNLLHILNKTGIAIIASTTLLASLFFLTKVTPAQIVQACIAFWHLFKGPKKEEVEAVSVDVEEVQESSLQRYVALKIPAKDTTGELLAIQPETQLTTRPSLSQKEQSDRKKISLSTQTTKEPSQRKQKQNLSGYQLPSLSLLTNAKKIDQSSLKQDLRRQAEVLEETLQSFGIEAKVGQINCGPTITSFEVHPSIGVKVQKIKALENDIALNMEAKSIRIIAPIPGKAAVGIEVPNAQAQEVGFKEMLAAYQQGSRKFHIPILLGKAVNGEYVMSDLTKMPHCIIAGATGSGKSVCINTIVMSILMNATPDEIKLLMVDPKKVELTPYTRLPHMLAPVITEPLGACAALNWLVKEMEKRYEILKQLGVRNIEAFNNRKIDKDLEASLDREIPERMPYILLIIDELADLMMVSSNDIETPIARIAQMARAVGIHMILATQRPSREVITGLIKANFPTRISFKVASRINSQIILDEVGAETLLGNGDMLFLPPGTSTLVRAQGAFIRDEDIMSVVNKICSQASPNYVISSFDDIGKELSEESDESQCANDRLYDQAVYMVLTTGNASTTFLQRKLKIGYARAASLIDEMESKQVIGKAEGSKPRKILLPQIPGGLSSNNEPELIEDLADEK